MSSSVATTPYPMHLLVLLERLCNEHRFPLDRMGAARLNPGKDQEVRDEILWRLYHECRTRPSKEELARLIGKRSHATIVYAIRRHQERLNAKR